MTKNQKRLRELQEQRSKNRQRLAELAAIDGLEAEQRSELDAIEESTPDLERQIRAAQVAVDDETEEAERRGAGGGGEIDAETRERRELRGRCVLGRYFEAALRGRLPTGAEAEFGQAAKVPDGTIPFDLWEADRDAALAEQRAITPAPTTVGVNLAPLQPFVFSPSVAPRLMVDMPHVESGTYASGTITTAATADAVAKGADVPETAAAFTVQTTVPHRIGASLNLSAEDVKAVGQDNFESLLRQHLSLVVSEELDNELLNGDPDTDADDISGFFKRLTDSPETATASVYDYGDFLKLYADGIDGLWASTVSEVAVLMGLDSYRLAVQTYRTTDSDESFAAFAARRTAGLSTSNRMPATDATSKLQKGILCRKGRSMMPAPMRTAVCPHWGYFQIDDIYTGARKAERRFVINTLIGDLIVVQAGAYKEIVVQTTT
ncbi:MAG: phage major capsid protein [Gammaproteobacteria bacterium]|nr:phage major capsid protein [Gammaproteobacteria bacterium]